MNMQKLLDWFRDHFVFSKTVIFIWGLVLSYSLAEYAVVYVLIDYLGDTSKQLSLRKAAMVVNLIDGGSAVFVVIVTHISESCYIRNFYMIVLCTAAYVSGLSLLYVSASSHSKLEFYVAVVLIALGKAGKDPPLQSFLEFQLREKVKQSTESLNGDNEKGEDRIDISTEVWWRTAWISGAAIAIFVLGNPTWRQTFIACALMMGVNYLLFLFGFFYYHYETPTGSPLSRIYRVLKAALFKLNFEYPDSAEKYYWKDQRPNYWYSKKEGEFNLLPHAPLLFTFLDKAAIIREASNVSPERQEEKGELCTVTQVREVKRLIPMVYLGFSFLAYSLVAASGNTYFVEQTSNLNPQIGSFKMSVSFLFVLKSVARDVIRFSFWWFELTQQRITTWRIGVGMFCAVLCCITAWQVELHRLSLIKREGVQDTETIVSLSILVLIPQYFLLGLMEGLAENGLGEFFYNYVPKSLRNFEQPFSEMVLSIGKFLSIPCVLIFGSWFKETINTSRLDKYFLMLAILSFVFLCIYLYYSSRYIFMEKYPEDEQLVLMENTLDPTHDAAQQELGSFQGSSMIEEEIDTAQGLTTIMQAGELHPRIRTTVT